MTDGPAVAELVFPLGAEVALTGADGVGGVEGGELGVGFARILERRLGEEIGAVAAEAGVLFGVLGVAGEEVFVPVVSVVEEFAVEFEGAVAVVLEEVAAQVEAVVHRPAGGGAVAFGVAVEAADVVDPALGAEGAGQGAAHGEVAAVLRGALALEAEAGADLAAETVGAVAGNVVEGAAGGIGGGDGGAAAADGFDALEGGVGAVEVAGAVVAEADVGDGQAVFLHGDVVGAGGAVGAVGGDAAGVDHAADFAEGRVHEDAGDVEEHVVGAEGDLLGEQVGVEGGDGGGGLAGLGGVEDAGDDELVEFDGVGGLGGGGGLGGADGGSGGGLGGECGGEGEEEEGKGK